MVWSVRSVVKNHWRPRRARSMDGSLLAHLPLLYNPPPPPPQAPAHTMRDARDTMFADELNQ